jgi:hypothetical protein
MLSAARCECVIVLISGEDKDDSGAPPCAAQRMNIAKKDVKVKL